MGTVIPGPGWSARRYSPCGAEPSSRSAPRPIWPSRRAFMALHFATMIHARWPDISTSISGVPEALSDAAKTLADQRDMTLKELYTEAIETLLADLEKGDEVVWPATRPGVGQPYAIRVNADILEQMRAACDRHQTRRTNFFLAAVSRYLGRHGIEVKV